MQHRPIEFLQSVRNRPARRLFKGGSGPRGSAQLHECRFMRFFFDPDLNGDGVVDGTDLGLLLGQWGPCSRCPADLNDDGVVDASDLGILWASWATKP